MLESRDREMPGIGCRGQQAGDSPDTVKSSFSVTNRIMRGHAECCLTQTLGCDNQTLFLIEDLAYIPLVIYSTVLYYIPVALIAQLGYPR